jgi:hypothetical protein
MHLSDRRDNPSSEEGNEIHCLRVCFAILPLAFIGIGVHAGMAQVRTKGAILVTPHFVFYSDLATNTHKLFSETSRAAVSRTFGHYIEGTGTLDQAAHDLAESMKTSAPR